MSYMKRIYQIRVDNPEWAATVLKKAWLTKTYEGRQKLLNLYNLLVPIIEV